MVPPRVAYKPQVPRLFSQSLADNVRLGLPVDDADLVAMMESRPMTEADLTTAEVAAADLPRVSGTVTIQGRTVGIATDDPTLDLLALCGWAAGRCRD